MRDIVLIFAFALASALAVGAVGTVLLRLLRGRSITAHILLLLTLTVVAVCAGTASVARAMFLSAHDLQVVLITVAAAALVSLAVGWVFGHRLAAAAMWAAEARERERQVEAGRRDLIAWVSHDLRTPLAGMRAMAEALEDHVVSEPDAVAEYHRRIRGETDRMTRLVDDLFELSRINAGALRLSMSTIPLRDIVSDAIATTAPIAEARHIRLIASDTGWRGRRTRPRDRPRPRRSPGRQGQRPEHPGRLPVHRHPAHLMTGDASDGAAPDRTRHRARAVDRAAPALPPCSVS